MNVDTTSISKSRLSSSCLIAVLLYYFIANEEHKKAVKNLRSQFNRISNLADVESCNKDLINKFVSTLANINSGSQLDTFLASKKPPRRQGKIIKVQPTARARRNSHLGCKRGAKRL